MQSQNSLVDVIDRLHADNFAAAVAAGNGALAHARATGPDEDLGGDERKEEAMAAVVAKRPAQIYKGHLESALFEFIIGDRFTVEQLTGIIGRPPAGVHFNSVGAIINGMAKRGLIRKTGRMVKAIRPGMHSTELAQWELVKYPERAATD